MRGASDSGAVTRSEARDHLLQLVAQCGEAESPAVDGATVEWLLLAWFAKGVLTLGDVAELGSRLAKVAGQTCGPAGLRVVSYRLH